MRLVTRVSTRSRRSARRALQTRVLASIRGDDAPLFRVFSGIAHPARGNHAVSNADRRNALLAAAQQELDALAARGVRMRGNAFSAIVLVKGELNANELAGGELLAGADGAALAAALERLGYAPEEFCALSATAGPEGEGAAPEVASGRPLPPALFREALEALDPEPSFCLMIPLRRSCARHMPRSLLASSSSTWRYSLRGSSLMFLEGACLPSMDSRPRLPMGGQSSACGPISSSFRPSVHRTNLADEVKQLM